MKRLKQIIILLLISACCSNEYNTSDMYFSEDELALVNSFLVENIIYYKSNLGNIETIKITSIESELIEGGDCFISREPSNHKFVLAEHLPIDIYSGKQFELVNGKVTTYSVKNQEILTVSKYPIEKRNNYIINFKDFYFDTDSIQNYFFTDFKLKENYYNNVYVFTNNDSVSTNILLLSNKNGVLAYGNEKEIWKVADPAD